MFAGHAEGHELRMGKTRAMVRKQTAPPGAADDGSLRWKWFTIQLLESAALTTLSANACRAF
ncbi:hypothetical protein ACCS56_38105, partial [Rhizobium ruizarguesonis]